MQTCHCESQQSGIKSTSKIHKELLFTFIDKKVQMSKGHGQSGDLRAHFLYRKQKISQTMA